MENTNAGPTPVKINVKQQMRQLDLLPIELKQIIWVAPVSLDVLQVDTMLKQGRRKKCAIGAIVEGLLTAILREYPDWRPVV